MLDSDDTDSVSSTSTTRSDMMLPGLEEVQFDKETVLDQCVDALYEKRFDILEYEKWLLNFEVPIFGH